MPRPVRPGDVTQTTGLLFGACAIREREIRLGNIPLPSQEELKAQIVAIGNLIKSVGECPIGSHECNAGCCPDTFGRGLCRQLFGPEVEPSPVDKRPV